MNSLQLAAFQKTLEKSKRWIRDLMKELASDDEQEAYRTLRVVLHLLRDHLTLPEIAQLGAQMPMLIRGLYYEGWNPNHSLVREHQELQFLERMGPYFEEDELLDLEERIRAVFQVLARHIEPGEIQDVKSILPLEIRRMWELDEPAFL